MSRSRRKSPWMGLAGHSEKEDKRKANRKLRRVTKAKLCSGSFDEEGEDLPVMREVSNVYGFAKDGKIRIDPRSKWMRK